MASRKPPSRPGQPAPVGTVCKRRANEIRVASRRRSSENAPQMAGYAGRGPPCSRKHPVRTLCLARCQARDVQTIFLANENTVKLADSPLREGCGRIETARNGTFAAVVRRPCAAPGRPPVRAPAWVGRHGACTANVRGAPFVRQPTCQLFPKGCP